VIYDSGYETPPVFVHHWCRECDPEGEFVKEPWEPLLCQMHWVAPHGESDHVIDQSAYLTGTGESGGEENQRYCDLIHRST